MHKLKMAVITAMAVLLLSGCLYPEAKKLKIKYLTNISFSRCKRQWMNLKRRTADFCRFRQKI